jgi:hypothetical protein
VHYALAMRGLAPCLAVSALALATALASPARAESPPGTPPAAPATVAPVPGEPAQLAPSSSAAAPGDPAQLPPSSSVPAGRRWYGGAMIATDVLSLVVLPLAGAITQSSAGAAVALTLGAGGYLIGGPTIHGLNGAKPGTIAGSFALRLGLPLTGLLIGIAAGESSEASCEARGDELCGLAPPLDGILAMAIGMIAASIIDSAALAWTSAKPDAVTPPAPRQALRLTPLFGMRRDDAPRDGARAMAPTFGVAGAF